MKLTSRLLAAGISIAFAATPAHAGLVGHWTFGDGSGTTAADSSANGYDADVHVTEGTSAWTTGKVGGAYNQPRFTLDVTESDALNMPGGSVTISLWVTAHNTANWAGIAGFEGTGTTGDIFGFKMSNADKIIWTTGGGSLQLEPTVSLTDYAAATSDGWVHLVGTYDGTTGTSTIYVNGSQVLTGITAAIPDKTPSSLFRIGTYWNSNSYEFNGAVDDVQLYDQALDSSDVTFLNINPGSVLGGGPTTVTMGAPSVDTVTDDGATVECPVFNDDANDVTVVWAFADQGETDVSTWTSAPGGGSHSFGAASQDDVLSHLLIGLGGDTQYSFRFFATAGVDSDWSEAGSIATGLGGSPAPADLAGTAATGQTATRVDLIWTDSYSNETGFVIRRSTDPGFGTFDEFLVDADETSFTDDTTEPNTTYYYRIAAEGASGTGPFAANIEVTTGDDPPKGLIGHWTFDEVSGTTAADSSSANGYDADQTVTAGSWITGKVGGAYNLPRFALDATESDALDGGTSITLSAWVTTRTGTNFEGIAGFENTGMGQDIYSLKMDNADKINWTVDGNGIIISPSTLTTYAAATGDGWVHLVGVFEQGSTHTLYVNGSPVVTGSNANAIQDENSLFAIGSYQGANSYAFTGSIDDVQVYSSALSADDVAFLYANPGSALGAGSTTFELTITPDGSGGNNFIWESQDGKVYDLVSTTDPSTAPITWPVWDSNAEIAGTAPTNMLTNVPAGGDPTRFFAVVEKDPPPLLEEDFEAGIGDFTIADHSAGGTGTDWTQGVPMSGSAAASNPGGYVDSGNGNSINCVGTDIGNPGVHAADTDTCLRSGVIDLTGVAGATLRFAQALDIEAADTAVVHIIDDTDDNPATNIIASAIYTATDGDLANADWATVAPIAIPGAALGQAIRIEWRFTGVGGVTFDYMGWYIDDVVVTETP